MIRLVILCSVLALPVLAWCQEASSVQLELLTLDKALKLALQDNLKVKNAGLEVQKAQDDVAAIRTRRLPSLHLSVLESHNLTKEAYEFKEGVFGNFPATGPIPSEDTEIETHPGFTTILSASLDQPLSQLYRIDLNIQQREIQQAMTAEKLRSQRQSVANKVKQAYYGVLRSESALEATKEAIKFYLELDKLVDRYLKEQTVLKSESLEVKTRLAKAEYEALTQRNNQASQKEKLNNLLGRDIRTGFNVNPVPESTIFEVNLEAAQALAIEQRPEIREANLKVKHAEYARRIKQSEYIPDLSLRAAYYTPFNVELLPKNVAKVGLYLKWEFYDWGRKQNQLAEKSKTIRQANNDVQDSTDKVLIEVNNRFRKLQESRAQLRVARMSRETAREKQRITMNEYKQQTVLLKSVLQADTSLAETKRRYEDALLSFWKAKADFEKALGEE
ncbi:MAG: TolC family protein [bacterium]|nr:TolC family protein [bacterium]